jgi:hypothetical protein
MVAITIDGSPELGRYSVIDSSSYLRYADDSGTKDLRGYEGRNYSKHPFGSLPFGAIPFKTIPRSEWRDRIAEGHAKKTFPIYHQLRKKVPIKNQRRTPFCWINSVTGAIQSIRAVAGWDTIALSSASAGAPGKNYRSEGGWTGEAIGYIQKYGLVPEDQWPNDAIDKSYFRGTREVAELYGIGQWFELRAKNFDEVMTCLLMNYPVPVGLLWWGHSIFYSAPVYESGAYGVIGDNSWGPEWENEGRTVLMEDKATPDEANCVTSPKLVADPITTKKFTSFFSSLKAA